MKAIVVYDTHSFDLYEEDRDSITFSEVYIVPDDLEWSDARKLVGGLNFEFCSSVNMVEESKKIQ